MESAITQFESEIRQKITLKSSSYTSSDTVLLKAFKYFDLDGSDSVDFQEWKKALQKIGVVLPSPELCEKLFNYYDTDRSGSLDYHEFASLIQSRNSNKKSLSTPITSCAEHIIQLIRAKLQSSRLGLIGLSRSLKLFSDGNLKTVDFSALSKSAADCKVILSHNELMMLFKYFDQNGAGRIDYGELVRVIKGKLSDFRKQLVIKAFEKLDSGCFGVIDIRDIKRNFNPSGHPEVLNGRKSESEVLAEFLESFEVHHSIYPQTSGRMVDFKEFLEYYSHISVVIESDEHFEVLVNNSWKLKEAEKTMQKFSTDLVSKSCNYTSQSFKSTKSRPYSSLVKTSDALFQRFREQLAIRGSRGIIGIQRLFKIIDDDNSHSLSLAEFRKACKDFNLNFNDAEILRLFNAIDRDRNGVLDYDEFLRVVRGPMSQERLKFVRMAFEKLDKDKNGVVNIEDISQVYDARNHPDVKAGKRSVADILNEFLETFETHHNLSDLSRRDRNVTLEEFEEYYENVSASIDNDLYFEVMMKNAWKIPEPGKQQAPWHASIPFAGKSRQVQRSSGPPFAVSETPTCFSTSSKDKLLTPVESILDEFKAKLKARGARGFIGLARQFKVMDDDRSGKINFTEFLKALKDFRVDLSPEDASKLFRFLDADRSGEIDYEELVHRVRGELNEMRKQLVLNVFQSLDKDGNGVVNVEDINGVFTADKHPDVRNGRKSQEQVLREFLEGFEMHHALFRENTQDGNVTLEEFLEYYKHLSASIDDDRYFEMMIRNAWKLNGKENGKAWSCNFGRKGF